MTPQVSSRAALMGSSALAPRYGRRRAAALGAAVLLLAAGGPALAQSAPPLPSGGVFTAGSGTIQSDAARMTITQSSDRGVIDWRDFSIAAENQVAIRNGSGATLNRVNGGTLSRIDGMLTATGSVYLINPHGVVVGPGGQVITGGSFVASTRAIDGEAFMAGGALAARGSSDGAIVNAGAIESKTGSVVMIARSVRNSGSISAGRGHVTLAAAADVLLAATDGRSDGIYVSVGGGRGDVTQTGRIEAASVALRAANGNIFALAGNRDGLVQATGTATIDGQLWLTAPQGKVEVAGTLRAVNADGSGGRITVNGHDVALAATAKLSAAGTRGGEVLVGTSGYGSGADLAHSTGIADGARISAGGAAGAGRIETSGQALDLGAATILPGAGGTWLIDPDDLVIDAAAAAGIVTTLNANGNVTQTTTAGGTGGVGDITVTAPIVWTGTGNLTIDAYRDVAINAAITGGGNLDVGAQRNIGINAAVSAAQISVHNGGTTTIGAAGSLSGGAAVRVETQTFVNQGGATALSSSGGDWLVASDDAAGSSDGGLTPDYYAYAYSNFASAPAPGNGRFYRTAPSLSFTLGAVIKAYDGTTAALLDASNVNMTGLINGDAFTLDGSYAGKDAGTGIDVTATNFQANRGGIPVYNYNVTTPSVTAATGTINRAVLTAAIIGNPTKTYNASTAVALTSANFQLAGLAAGESITVSGAATSAYDSANAGNRIVNAGFQTSSFVAGGGTLLTNYVLPTTATGAGLINPASILISGVTANDKVYDGTTQAVLNTGTATIFGVVAGDTVTLDTSGAAGVFATRNVGNAIAVTGTGFALGGASAANYVVTQPSGLAANITRAALIVSGLTANDKVYDGTRFASVNTGGLVLSGLVPGDDIVPIAGSGAQIEFAQKDVGTGILVTISGVTLSGADAGNYNLDFSTSLNADITPRPLAVNANGMPTKIYDGTTQAFVLQSQVVLGNLAAGESITLSQATGLSYASKNVGLWDIDFSLSPSDYQAGANTLLSNYILPASGTILGEITPAPLTITIVGDPTKTYDGNANASLGPSNFAVDGFVSGEGATITQTSGQYASSDAGFWGVTATLDASNFDPNAGTLMSNYSIPSPVAGFGTIVRRDLGPGVVFVDITGNPTRIYDGTTIVTLVPGDYTLGGFVAGEGATITETVGEYSSADAGQRAVTVQLDPGDFDPFPGTNLANYTLPTEATGLGTILRAPLSVAIIGNPTKVYNGTTRIGLNPLNFAFTGLVAGETITVRPGNIGDFDDADAGSRTVAASFPGLATFLAGPNTLLTNYVLPTSATGPGTITPAPLNILNVGAQSRVYDRTNVAQLTGSATLFGLVSGDDVSLSSAGSTGTFATANVGNGIAVTVAGFTISGADIANYTLAQPTGITANITPRGLTIAGLVANDKFYDGTTAATLGGAPVLTGVLGGDTVTLDGSASTGSFLQVNVGNDLRVNVGGFALAGAQAGNYALSQPSGLTADINPLALTGAILGNPTKTYDGTTSVSLGSANYALTGFIAGEGGSITQSSGASYDSANAGARTVTATLVVSDFVANAGTLLSNYVLPASISGAGTINQATLIAAIIGNPTKAYDATTAAALTGANYQLQGFVAGEGASLTQAAGTYASKNVGTRSVTATLGAGDFTATGGTLLANYVLPTSASGSGTITQAIVQVIGIVANDKVYDGTTTATLNSAAGGLTGVFGGDAVALVSTGASGTFATRNVGTNIAVTATGYAISGADALNYAVLQPVGLAADITQATLQVASVTKVYDATTTVPTVNGAYTLSGVVAGDAVSVSAGGITGSYDTKNVGTGKFVTLAGVAITGADAANYTIATTVTNQPIGIITPATLNVLGALALDKTYDQNTIAQLDNSGTTLSGVFGGDVVNLTMATTGNFNNANAGTNKPVTTTAYAITGGDAGNYTLVQPQGLSATINPLEIFLASVTKVYDGTTALPSASTGYSFTGVLSGDTVTAQTGGITGQYNDDKNVGNPKPVTVNGLTLTGAQGGNYFISSSITGNIGAITPAPLSVTITGDPTKTYDGNNTATLVSGDYTITGLVAGEVLTINQTAGVYDTPNAGARTVDVSLNASNYTEVFTSRDNYILPTSATGAGTIDPRLLTVTGVVANDKVYDGNTNATLNSAGATLNNVVSGDAVALNSGAAAGQFATRDVGTNIAVTASGYTLDNNAFGNYTLQQPLGLSADITQALITLTAVTRVYDGTTALPGTAGAYTLSGVVAGDTVTVDAGAAAASGSYAGKNVANGILVSIGNLLITGADAGNYSIAPSISNQPIGFITPATLAAAIINTPTRVYDGTNVATLTSGNYQLTGFVAGEGATVTQTAGSYDSANAGARTVTATLTGADFTADLGTDLANYTLPTSASGAGQIDQRALAAMITGTPTKIYDGTTLATLAAGNFNLIGFVSGEGATVSQTVGTYGSANAGPRAVTATLAMADFTANGGTLLANYILPTSAAGLGQIDQRTLTAAVIGTPTKVYDGNTAATLAPANYQLSGFVSGEGATVTRTSGTYASADAGSRAVTVALAGADFTADSGTLLANYVLPTSATGPGLISQAVLTALVIGNPTRVYDGTTAATLGTGNYQLVGFVPGQGATVTQTIGSYDSPNAGARTVSALLAGGDFTPNSGTDLANYVLPTGASGGGTITQAMLTAAIVGTPTRIYDGTTNATLTSGNYQLTGFVSGESATVNQSTGSYDSANAGPRIVTASLAAGNFAAGSGTLLGNYVLPVSASGAGLINQRAITAAVTGIPTKVYDATTAATLSPANYQLSGFVAGEGATVTQASGSYAAADAGFRLVSVVLAGSDFAANSGTLLSNYTLPVSASGTGLIDRAQLVGLITGNPSKIYDGTIGAQLTSANYQLTGFVAGQGATVTETTGTYGSPDAGVRTVTATLGSADFVANAGTSLTNYRLPTSASGLGTIDRATLAAAIIGNPTKGYDGTVAATLASGNYQLTGFIAGEGASITQTAGSYDSPDAGARTVTTSLAASDFAANGGTQLSNYTLPVSASGAGTIGQALITAAIIGNPTKVYDGTILAALTSGNYQLTGFATGEGATVNQTAGTYVSANAGPRTVSATLAGGDFTANAGTNLANYVLPTGASGPGLISQAVLMAIVIGMPAKTYDGTSAAILASGNYQLTGFVTGEGASVTQTSGSYGAADAGTRTVTATLSAGDFAADPGTLLSNYVLPASAAGLGRIDPATLTAILIGNPTRAYDGTTIAALTSANYQLGGFIAGEGATVTQASGAYASPNAGIRLVSATLGAGDFVADSGTTLANYVLPTSAAGFGTIDQALLTAAIIGTPTRTYDGTTAATLTAGNYQLSGFAAGEGASIGQTSGVYDSPNAGPRLVTASLVAGDFTATGGTLLSNYVLPTSASGAGLIDPATLTAIIIGNPTRTYDATTLAALTSGNYQLSGFIAGESATVSQGVGVYASPNAGTRLITATLVASDFTAGGGTLLSNYLLPTNAVGLGTIDPALLTAAIIGNPTRAYDGTNIAALLSANYQLTGFVAGEGATVTQAAGAYDGANAGPHLVSASLAASDFAATGGTLLSNYVLPTSASGNGTIGQAALSAILIGNPTRTYDATTLAALTSANYQLSGFVAGEGATVTQAAGAYDSPNAGSRIITAILAAGDFTADSGTLLSNYLLPTSAVGPGTIDPALLSAAIIGNPTRAYDGTTAAVLVSANYQLTGFVAGEGATVTQAAGAYDGANAGPHLISATLAASDFAATGGTLLSNYLLPTSASGNGTIGQAALSAILVGNPTRIYDGTTAAALTSANYQLGGFVGGESATVIQTMGSYANADAGTWLVTASLGANDFAAGSGTLLANYLLPTSAAGMGAIDRAILVATIINNPTRVYDATTLATLASGNFLLSGFVAGEGAGVTQTAGAYDSANAGNRTVTATLGSGDFAANSGTSLANYILPTSASGAGTIDRANLTASITGNPTKRFDGTTTATLAPSDYMLTGFVGSEGASITQTRGSYAAPDVGEHQVTAALATGDYAANGGTLLSNYNLPTVATGPGEIIPAIGPHPCATPTSLACGIRDLPILLGSRRFYIPYPSPFSVYLAQTNAFAALPGVLRQSSVTPIPGGLLIRTGMPTINSAGQVLLQGAMGKEYVILFPPVTSGAQP